jgi:hypothetical protein
MIFRFRVLLDTEEDVFRDIALTSDSTFEDLHLTILAAFGWEASQMASFYESNEEWDKGNEIPLMDIDEEFGPTKRKVMSEVKLEDIVKTENQKLLYVFDFMLMWCFYVDVVSITEEATPEQLATGFPTLMMSVGDAPEQTSKEPVSFVQPNDDENEDEEGGFNFDDLIEN